MAFETLERLLMDDVQLSVVIPVFNEDLGITELVARLAPVLASLDSNYEILFVDDGSSDRTVEVIHGIHAENPHVNAIVFSRNFGKEVALAAGLRYARGQAVIIMDADLQHPPESLPAFVDKWREGYEMVYGVRTDRSMDGPLRRWLTRKFYDLFSSIGDTALPEGAGDFRLIDRRAVDALNALVERARFTKGLYAWVGFKSIGVPFDMGLRYDGKSRWSTMRLFNFAMDGLTSFSTAPLRAAIYTGLFVSMIALISALYFIFRTIMWGVDVPGFPSLIVSLMFFSGVQLFFLGVIGEYLGRVFDEVKRRPLFIVRETIGLGRNHAVGGSIWQVGQPSAAIPVATDQGGT
jgi:polyisoprenyl-phosphate glycosyltransferase